MTETQTIGRSTGGKTINLGQLQDEMVAAGVDVGSGLGMQDGLVFRFTLDERLEEDFLPEQQPLAEQTITAHVAMRPKTDPELAAEFQDPATTPARKQEIRDMQNGLLPREQVPM